MRKLLPLCFALFFLSANLNSQNKTFDWGTNLALENNVSAVIFADSLGNAYFNTQNKNGDRFIEMQTLHGSKTSFKTQIGDGKSDYGISRIYNVANGIEFLGFEYSNKTSQVHFKQNAIDWKGNLKSAEALEFLTIPINKKDGLGSIHICISPDKSKIIVTYRAPESEVMKLYGFDEDFNKLFEKETHFYKGSKHGLFSASDFLVSNSGDFVYQVEKIKITKKNGDWESIDDWCYIVPFESTSTDSVFLKGGDEHLTAVGYLIDNSEIIVFGIAGNKSKTLDTYFSRYDINQKKFVAQSTNELTADMFITPGALDNWKGKPGFPRSSIDIRRSKTGYYIIMDAGTYNNSSGPNGISSLMIVMSNCSILSVSNNGNVNWIVTLFRDHVGAVTSGQFGIIVGGIGASTSANLRSDDFSLYGMTGQLVGEDLIFFMNDDISNTPQPSSNKDITPVRKTKQLSACIIRVSKDGKITKELVSGTNGETIRWHPTYTYISEGYIYEFYDGKESAGGVLVK